MLAFIVRRIVRFVVLIFLTLTLVFMLFRLVPGGLEYALTGGLGTTAELERMREQLGLNDPLWVQYGRYLGDLLHGNFGYSLAFQGPVLREITSRLPASLLLIVVTVALVACIGLPVGIVSAIRGRAGLMVPLFLLYAIPHFVIALLMITLFAAQLRWLPAFGFASARSLIMPAIATAAPLLTINARMVRASVLDVMDNDYVRTARSKGIAEWRLVVKHVLRNASIPVVTSIGMQVGYLLGGHVVIEQVFAWPGIGQLLIQAANARDYPTVQALTILLTAGFLLVNLVVDISYAKLDPRIRLN